MATSVRRSQPPHQLTSQVVGKQPHMYSSHGCPNSQHGVPWGLCCKMPLMKVLRHVQSNSCPRGIIKYFLFDVQRCYSFPVLRCLNWSTKLPAKYPWNHRNKVLGKGAHWWIKVRLAKCGGLGPRKTKKHVKVNWRTAKQEYHWSKWNGTKQKKMLIKYPIKTDHWCCLSHGMALPPLLQTSSTEQLNRLCQETILPV